MGRTPSPQTGTLGEFLRDRRARLSPEDVSIRAYGTRRVPGLRREELALLAGVSATYYTRLEQGQSVNASESVINAIANALQLDHDERIHLHNLARPPQMKRHRTGRAGAARPGISQLIAAIPSIPALVLGRRTEILAWNPLAHSLLASHYDFQAPSRAADRPNLIGCSSWILTPVSCTRAGMKRPRELSPPCAWWLASTLTTPCSQN